MATKTVKAQWGGPFVALIDGRTVEPGATVDVPADEVAESGHWHPVTATKRGKDDQE